MLTPSLLAQLDELSAFGADNDAAIAERPRRMLNITPETGRFLYQLVRHGGAREVLEIGTSNGYSTLWLAAALAGQGGRVTTLDCNPAKLELARANFDRAGLAGVIDARSADAAACLREAADSTYDLIFLDADRSQYQAYWPDLFRTLRAGGLIVVDNATSHADECAGFFAQARATAGAVCECLPLGNGEFLILKE